MIKMPEPSMGLSSSTETVDVTVSIDVLNLNRISDERLALYWHVAQANPAQYDDRAAGDLAAKIGTEIIRRWLRAAPVEMYAHQQQSHFWSVACALGKWTGPNREFELDPTTPQFQAALDKLKATDENGQSE